MCSGEPTLTSTRTPGPSPDFSRAQPRDGEGSWRVGREGRSSSLRWYGGGVLDPRHEDHPSSRLSPDHPSCILLESLGRGKELAFTVVPRCTVEGVSLTAHNHLRSARCSSPCVVLSHWFSAIGAHWKHLEPSANTHTWAPLHL